MNALGLTPHEVTDADDFAVTTGSPAPPWHAESVTYEIFPDRFATSHLDVETPPWAIRRPWEALPTGRGRQPRRSSTAATSAALKRTSTTSRALGANLVYLTPFFPATSTPPLRRDDASTTSTRCSAETTRFARSATPRMRAASA